MKMRWLCFLIGHNRKKYGLVTEIGPFTCSRCDKRVILR